MKKLFTILLASVVSLGAVGLVACGDDDKKSDGGVDGTEMVKPVMPADSNMQTVENDDIIKQFESYYTQLKENGYGRYQAYSFAGKTQSGEQEFSEHDNPNKTEVASFINEFSNERSDNYIGTRDNDSAKAAATFYEHEVQNYKINSSNSNITKWNDNSDAKYVYTGLQKNSELYGFSAADLYWYGEGEIKMNYKTDKPVLNYYEDCIDAIKKKGSYIPCAYAAVYELDGTAINNVATYLTQAYNYTVSKAGYVLCDDDLEEAMNSKNLNVIDFVLSAKKNDDKFYATTKFRVEYNSFDESRHTVTVGEYSVVIDLSKPTTDVLPTAGIDFDKVSLATVDNISYLDLNSKKLSEAVKEGKEITVNILGCSDYVSVGDITSGNRITLPVADGKVKIDGKKIQVYIDNIKKDYQENGLEFDGVIMLTYGYVNKADNQDFDLVFNGYIDIDY